MKEVEIGSIKEYLEVIKESKETNFSKNGFTDIVFRGQPGDHPLVPKICRLKSKGNIIDIERSMLQEFKRSNPLLIQEHQPVDDWDYLTLGQHFGLPTRLLDWSNNALTALWFSTSGGNASYSEYAVIWVLMLRKEDFLEPELEHPFDVSTTRMIRPRLIKQRINNQSGVFSVTSTDDLIQKRYLNESDSYAEKLIKVKIPAGRFNDIRNDLDILGINAFTIFPELEGLCAYLQWRYFE